MCDNCKLKLGIPAVKLLTYFYFILFFSFLGEVSVNTHFNLDIIGLVQGSI